MILVVLIIGLAAIGVYGYLDTKRDFRAVLEELQVMTYVLSQPAAERLIIYPPRALWERIQTGQARMRPEPPGVAQ